ncbi:MAG: LCP family protein [Jiangellaceae bacterium]
MTVVAPGSAQIIAGHRTLGKIVLGIFAGLVAMVGLVLWLVPLDTLAGLAVRPWLLTWFKIAAFLVALAWGGLIVDAWRLGDPPGLNQRHRLIMVGVSAALVIVVVTPFVQAAKIATAAHDAVVAMFPSGEVAAASDGRLNIMLLGADAGDGREGLRPDSINVVSVDARTGRSVMISLPRNLEKARFAEGTPADAEFPRGFDGDGDRSDYLLNATWTYGEDHPELFDGPAGPGATAVEQAVEGTLGIDVHYYAVVDLVGFRDLIDALGGVTIRVEQELPIGNASKTLKPGLQTLDGYHALWYARSREGATDYARMARQRCVFGAILNEADPQTVLTNFTELADASQSIVTTDIPRDALSDLIGLAVKAKSQDLTALQFVPPLITPADPDFDLIAEKTDELLSSSADETAATPEPAGDQPEAEPASAPSEQPADQPAEDDQPSEPVDVSTVCSYE